MNAKQIIQTWRWRIVKAGLNTKQFAEALDMPPSLFSEYFAGKKHPSIEKFDEIEAKLKELGV